jgi:PPOX class probable F420-dependent enzyme
MLSADDRAFLERPAFAALATVSPGGAPQLTMMWYRLEGDEIHMVTPAATQKVRNLERSPRAAIVVTDPGDPYRYLELRGAVEVRREPSTIAAELRQIAARYIGERAEAYTAARDPNTRALIVFRPDRIHRYDGTPVS